MLHNCRSLSSMPFFNLPGLHCTFHPQIILMFHNLCSFSSMPFCNLSCLHCTLHFEIIFILYSFSPPTFGGPFLSCGFNLSFHVKVVRPLYHWCTFSRSPFLRSSSVKFTLRLQIIC